MNWREHLSSEPNICHGRMCIKGTRVMVSVVLDNLAAGMAEDEVVRLYPSVSVNDVHAAVSYAAELARERLVTLAA